jgi:hypothetical protein
MLVFCLLGFVFFFFFVGGGKLKFELGPHAWKAGMLRLSHTSNPFYFGYFGAGGSLMNLLLRLASNLHPFDLSLPSS